MARTKTVAVSETVWERLREIMRKEHAPSMNDAIAKLVERSKGVPASKFGAHKKLNVKLTQEEHEEITRDFH